MQSGVMENATTSIRSDNKTLTPDHLTTDVNLYGGSSVTVVISEVAIRNIYVSIGSVGFVGNLLVISVLILYTNVTEKVHCILCCFITVTMKKPRVAIYIGFVIELNYYARIYSTGSTTTGTPLVIRFLL